MNGISRELAQMLVAELPALRRFATALCGNAALADDLVQDCLERALTQGQKLREVRSLSSWLRTVLHNLFRDEMRRRSSHGPVMDVQDLADHVCLSTPANDGAVRDLVAATALLSAEHRHILVLAGVESLSYREIADELDLPVGTVMSRLARARMALRNILSPADSTP